jgi:hypothetical protein
MPFICSCRNKNQPKAIYPKGTSHHAFKRQSSISTQRVYGLRLVFVSARTNKRHHHQAQSQTGPASVSPRRRSCAPQPQTHPVSASPPTTPFHPTRKYCSHQFPPSSPLGEPAKLITQDLPAFCANNFPAPASHLQTFLCPSTPEWCSHQFPSSESPRTFLRSAPIIFRACVTPADALVSIHTRVMFTPISTFLPPWRACEAFRGQRLACSRQLPHCRSQRTMGLHGIHQPVGSNNRRPRLETVAALTGVHNGGTPSHGHWGRMVISHSSGPQACPRGPQSPCCATIPLHPLVSLTTCYDTGPALPGPTLRTDLDTKVHAAQARVLASAVHDHSLSLY